jgi:HK97 family phage major capsid protein
MELTKEVLETQLKSLKEDLEKGYNEKLEAEIKRVEAELEEKNRTINERKYKENPQDENEEVKKLEEINKNLKDIAEKKSSAPFSLDVTVVKAANSQLSSGAGSGLVNTQLGTFNSSLNQYGYIRQYAKKIPLVSNSMTIPYIDTSLSLSATTELDNIQDSNPTLAYLTFTQTAYSCTIPFSKQLRMNTPYDIAGELVNEAQIAADSTLDTLYKTRLQALGTTYKYSSSATTNYVGSPASLSGQTFAQGITSSTLACGIIAQTIAKLAALNIKYTENMSLQMHPSTMWQLAGIADANNGRNVIEFDTNGIPRHKGIQINQSNAFSAPTVALTAANSIFIGVANLSDAAILAETGQLDVELFNTGNTSGVNLLTQFAEAYRVTNLYDLQLKKRATFFGA